MIEAVIFDMDGLMIDSEGNESISYEKVLREHGVEPRFNEAGVVQTVGIKSIDNWKRLKKEHSLAVSAEELRVRKTEVYRELLEKGVQAQAGLIELIADLETAPVKKAVASSSLRDTIGIVMGQLGLDTYFDAIVSGQDVEHGKPAPDIYLEAAHQLGVAPENCVALEDASAGVQAAHAAGMKVIAVPNRYTNTHTFDEADLVVASLSDLNWNTIRNL